MDRPIDSEDAPLFENPREKLDGTMRRQLLWTAAEGKERIARTHKPRRPPVAIIELIPGIVLADGSVSLTSLPEDWSVHAEFAGGHPAVSGVVMVPVSEIAAIGRERETDIADLSVCEVLTRSGLSGWAQALTLFIGDDYDEPAFAMLDRC